MLKINRNQKGFTLIEILVVIGIIAVLAVIVLVAINPAKQFAQARDTQRTSNVETILNAVGQRIADNKGVFAGSFTVNGNTYTCQPLIANTTYTIGVGTVAFAAPADTVNAFGAPPATAFIDLACLIPTYISTQLPVDPVSGIWQDPTHYNTLYNVTVDSAGRYTVSAPNALNETAIPGTPAVTITR